MRNYKVETNVLIFIFFLLISISVIVKNLDSKKHINFFWFCDFAPFLFALAFLVKDVQLVKALINVGLFGQIMTFTGVVPTRFREWKKGKLLQGYFYVAVEFIIHLTAVIALILTYSIKPTFQSLVYSLILLIFIFVITLIFTSSKDNINVIYYLEFDYGRIKKRFKLPYHLYLWIFYGMVLSLIAYLIQYSLYLFAMN